MAGEKICMICIKDIDERSISGITLISDSKDTEEILQKIFICAQVIFHMEIPFSKYLCDTCLYELNLAYDFRIKCQNAPHNMQSHINSNVQTEVHEEVSTDENWDIFSCKSDPDDAHVKPHIDFCSKGQEILHKNVKVKNYKCVICDKTLSTEASLVRHKILMHEKRKHVGKVTGFGATRLYNCTECSYSTPHSQTLVNHMRKHSGERPYHCHCGKSFTQASALTAHSKIHSNITYYTCPTCGKQFKLACALKKHFKVHEEGTYRCRLCAKNLKSKETFESHMRRHYNVHNYSCENCGNTFVTSSELINHRKKHKLQETVECHLCGFKTPRKSVLIQHIKRHTGEKSYKCDLCAVCFITLSELRIHTRTHTREKPYTCPACGQRFMHSSSVNKHVRNLHGNTSYKWSNAKEKNRNMVS
ncbi:hypothetical protein JYU34_010926 [Plutella xylostella]|uniref:Uncharacterized protein n=1 Tax=Plutella xylostella TaxID=51655 RepID=A0ABQ7QFM7_PLUXY|nr:hypothetical protein JYU34_010926 [Plutella xylostella]